VDNTALKCSWCFYWVWQGTWGRSAKGLYQFFKFSLLQSCRCYICVVM